MMIPWRQTLAATIIGGLCALSAIAGAMKENPKAEQSVTVKNERLGPYTHLAYLADGADLSTIKFEGIKKVKVATQAQSSADLHYCADQQFRDPGGSMYCPSTKLAAPAIAYRVTYSYRGQPLASDEYAGENFTFNVYFRPGELSPAVRETVEKHSMTRDDVAGYFDVTHDRALVPQVVIDKTASNFCETAVADGSLVHTDPKCQDRVAYRTITVPSDYITVNVEPTEPGTHEVASGPASSYNLLPR